LHGLDRAPEVHRVRALLQEGHGGVQLVAGAEDLLGFGVAVGPVDRIDVQGGQHDPLAVAEREGGADGQ
jgi:hypothetical protein